MINSDLYGLIYGNRLNTTDDCSDNLALANLGTKVFAWSGLIFVVMTVMAYVIDQYLPMTVQVLAHIGMLVSAGTFKLGYIVRLLGHRAIYVEQHRGAV